MRYKILFLDIDGTILKPDHTISEFTKEAIEQVKKRGIEVFFATGRPLHEITRLAKELKVDSFIGHNGAYAVYNNQTILNEPIDGSLIKRFLEIAKAHHHEAVLYAPGKNYFTSLDHPLVVQFNQYFDLKDNALFTEDAIDQILSLTVLNVKPSQTPLYEIDEDIRLSQVHVEGSEHAYDILRHTVNKGEAIKKVLECLNISKEQAIAFGDGMNDKEMLETAGESFAMGNAHPDLFPYAKHKTTSVTDAGIFNGLKTLGLVH